MPPGARGPYAWHAVSVGLVAALIWASLGVRAVVMDNDPSIRGLLVCAVLVVAGFALSPAFWMLTAPIRARRPSSEAAMLAEMKAPIAMLGVMTIGLGASQVRDASPNAWDWALMVVASLAGGLALHIAFMGFDDQTAPGDVPHRSTRASQPH